MSGQPIEIHAGEAPDVQAYLAERIHEFNAKTTGYFDAESFSATRHDAAGVIRAGICGYTWGGCCYISYLWVDESERGRGVGTSLLAAAEQHAAARRCSVVFVATHSFQAPAFYARLGYREQAVVHDHPPGHSSSVLAKRL